METAQILKILGVGNTNVLILFDRLIPAVQEIGRNENKIRLVYALHISQNRERGLVATDEQRRSVQESFSKLDADERRTTLSFLTGRLMQDDAECNEEWKEWISSEEVAIVEETATKLPKMLRVIDHALCASLSNDDNEDTNAPENTRKRALEDATAGIFASADSEEYEKMLDAIGRFPEIGDMLAERREIMVRVAQTTARARALERKVKAWIEEEKNQPENPHNA